MISHRVVVAGVLLFAGLTVIGLALSGHQASTPLPAPLAAAIERHAIASAVDTAEIARLRRVAANAEQLQQRERARAARADTAAALEHLRADSLARVAMAATSAADSAAAWQSAYDVRTREADSLQRAGDAKDRAIALGIQRSDSLGTALSRSEHRAARADSVLAATVKIAVAGDRCRLVHLLPCPTRAQAFVGGVAGGALLVLRFAR